jgi:hypothetical protein
VSKLILATHHIFEQAKFARQEIDRAIAAFGSPRQQIKLKRSNAQHGVPVLRGPAQQCFEPCDQLDNRKRLREIIVATRPQTAYTIVHCPKRAQDQNRGAYALLPDDFDDR